MRILVVALSDGALDLAPAVQDSFLQPTRLELDQIFRQVRNRGVIKRKEYDLIDRCRKCPSLECAPPVLTYFHSVPARSAVILLPRPQFDGAFGAGPIAWVRHAAASRSMHGVPPGVHEVYEPRNQPARPKVNHERPIMQHR